MNLKWCTDANTHITHIWSDNACTMKYNGPLEGESPQGFLS